MSFLTETLAYAPSLRERAAELRASLASAIAKRRVYMNTLHELENLTDRELADMAIPRVMIREIAYEAAYGKKN